MRCALLSILLAGSVAHAPAAATMLDPLWSDGAFSVNRDRPDDTAPKFHTGLAWAPDGSDRLFVLEKNGRVRVFSGGLTSATPAWSTFATMEPINTVGECGLIGMAFDPNFVVNGLIYFFVTVGGTEQQIIRYRDAANVGTERTIIRAGLPAGASHVGGGIGFAADGKLYWSIGDLGIGTGVDADLTSLAAKVGRANRDGSLPGDNPFADGAGPNDDHVFARGFRNPFTMQIHPYTGRIWLNVVGSSYEQVFIVGRGDHGGYNDYENNQPAGFLSPAIVYRTGSTDTRAIVSASRTNNITTFTTTGVHGFRVGGNLTIANNSEASFNQANLFVASVPTTTSFTAEQNGVNATGTGGQAITLAQGHCLTGGAFYDATLATALYRGNFFYGDCGSGRIMRARVEPASNRIIAIYPWALGGTSLVDVAAGPDSALYYAGNNSNTIYRATFNATQQGIAIANENLRIDEGGAAITTIRLAVAPSAPTQVRVTRFSGDPDIQVAQGATLTFTAADWMRPQRVRIEAAFDVDTTDDLATLLVASTGLPNAVVRVTVLDLPNTADVLFRNGFE